MDYFLTPLVYVPLLIVFAEMLAMVYFSRKRIRHRFLWIIGSYLFFTALCYSFGRLAGTEGSMGYQWLPLVTIAHPWMAILESLVTPLQGQTAWVQGLPGVSFGVVLNSALFYLLGKVSYPKHSAKLAEPQTT